jgi:hypothetical protein
VSRDAAGARGTTHTLGPADLLAIGAVALVVRIAYAAVLRGDYRPDSDADSYFQIARALSEGRGFVQSMPFGHDHPTAGRPPLYPVLVAPLFDLFGVHVGVAQAFNVAAGAGVAAIAAVAGARIAGRAAGVWSGLAVACYPPLIANDVTTLSETTACLLLLVGVVALARGRTFAAGTAMGALMLSRASAQWLLLAFAAWVSWRFGWRHAVRFTVVALLTVAPWVVRNAVQAGGPVIVTTNGFNLSARYSPEARADGGFVDAYNDPRFAAMRLRYTDEVAFDDALRGRAVDALAAHPGHVVRVVGSNVMRWFELTPGANDGPETLDGRHLGARHATLPLFYVVSLAGAAGLWRAHRSAVSQLLAVSAAYFTAVSLVSVSVPRLRAPVDLALAIGAGVLAATWRSPSAVRSGVPAPRPVPLGRTAAGAIVAVVACAVGGLVWRDRAVDSAEREIAAALRRDGGAAGGLLDEYPLDPRGAPPELPGEERRRLERLLVGIGGRAPQVPGDLRPAVDTAVRSLRGAARELDIVSLLSYGEVVEAERDRRRASIANVQRRYEHEVAPGDPTLRPWAEVARGERLTEARRALDALERTLRRGPG